MPYFTLFRIREQEASPLTAPELIDRTFVLADKQDGLIWCAHSFELALDRFREAASAPQTLGHFGMINPRMLELPTEKLLAAVRRDAAPAVFQAQTVSVLGHQLGPIGSDWHDAAIPIVPLLSSRGDC